MELTRSNIKEYLDNGFKNTNYYKKVRGTNKLETLETMTYNNLDFIEILKNLYLQIENNYNSFKSNANWTISPRQQHLLQVLLNINNDILQNEKSELKNIILNLYDDFFWGVYDYFDDYNNKNQEICKEEFDLIIPLLKKLLK